MLPTVSSDTVPDLAAYRPYPTLGLLAALALAGCATSPPESDVSQVHARMTARDTQLADAAVQRALESSLSGASVVWRNEDNGNQGTVTPLRTYRSHSGHFCRDYEETLVVEDRAERYSDTACRADGGDWRLVPVATR